MATDYKARLEAEKAKKLAILRHVDSAVDFSDVYKIGNAEFERMMDDMRDVMKACAHTESCEGINICESEHSPSEALRMLCDAYKAFRDSIDLGIAVWEQLEGDRLEYLARDTAEDDEQQIAWEVKCAARTT